MNTANTRQDRGIALFLHGSQLRRGELLGHSTGVSEVSRQSLLNPKTIRFTTSRTPPHAEPLEESLPKTLQCLMDLLAGAFQHQGVCGVRLVLDDQQYRTNGFLESPWKQTSFVFVCGKPAGLLEVHLTSPQTKTAEGSWKERPIFLDAAVRLVGKTIEGARLQTQLQGERTAACERVKELACLYGISQLTARHGTDLDSLFQGIVDLLPSSWQYPEICGARILLFDKHYRTGNFRETVWRQTAEIRVNDEMAGTIEVIYLEARPNLDEGPFLIEERSLLEAVAERTGRIVERIQTAERSEADQAVLKETTLALGRVLAQIEEEKDTIRRSICENVDKILMPTLRELEKQVPAAQKLHVAQAQRDLEKVTSPFARRLSTAFATLTPVELKICKMIQEGLSTDEIARLRHVSPATVTKQRERIRQKLRLQGTGTNLASFLLAFGAKEPEVIGL